MPGVMSLRRVAMATAVDEPEYAPGAHAVKAARSGGAIRFAGWALRYGSESSPDLSAASDFFDAKSDLWVDDDQWGRVSSPVLFHHGLDPTFGTARIGRATYHRRSEGVWAEGELKLRPADATRLGSHLKALGRLLAAGDLGLSSGVPGHLVERERRGDASWVRTWPLERAELSLTPSPAEPEATAVLKTADAEAWEEAVRQKRRQYEAKAGPALARRRAPAVKDLLAGIDDDIKAAERAMAEADDLQFAALGRELDRIGRRCEAIEAAARVMRAAPGHHTGMAHPNPHWTFSRA